MSADRMIKRAGLDVVLILAFVLFIWLFATQRVLVGSEAGNWWYEYIRDYRSNPGELVQPLLVFLLILPYAIILVRFSERHIRRYESGILVLWLVLATLSQITIHGLLNRYSFEQLILREDWNSFYTASLHHRPAQFLTEFDAIADGLPLHARTNMPGKTLFFMFLGRLTSSPQWMGYVIVAISNIGALLTYCVARLWFASRTTALYSLALYSFIPVKLYFLPIMNTLSPVLILASLVLFLLYLERKRTPWLIVLGPSLYLVLIFEPLAMVTGVLFVALLGRAVWRKDLTRRQTVAAILYPVFSFVVIHVLMLAFLHYDVFTSFSKLLKRGTSFFELSPRPYHIWVLRDPIDFFVYLGVGESIVVFLLFVIVVFEVIRARGPRLPAEGWRLKRIAEPAPLLLFSFLACVVFLSVTGLCRGEAIRLWIFLTGFAQMLAACFCAAGRRRFTLCILLAGSMAQGILGVSMVFW